MADAIRAHGYRLPARVPHYTPNGIPFGYPPLAFYLVAFIRDGFGVGPLTLTRFLPGLVTVLTVVPVYFLGREVFVGTADRNRRAGLAALVVAVSPAVFKWHLSAGGIVRAPAFLFTVTGLYVGIRLFREKRLVWAVAGAVLFGLTCLTHPSYPVFFATSYLAFFLVFDRSLAGLARGRSSRPVACSSPCRGGGGSSRSTASASSPEPLARASASGRGCSGSRRSFSTAAVHDSCPSGTSSRSSASSRSHYESATSSRSGSPRRW
nr:glycosyltransferase family 39 protein [Haladaptatus sp. AB643]